MSCTDIIWIIVFIYWINSLIVSKDLDKIPSYPVPPMPPKRHKCICNNIDKQSPKSYCIKCDAEIKKPEFPKNRKE